MAVALPPINGAKQKPTYAENAPFPEVPRGPRGHGQRLRPMRTGNRKEQELFQKRDELRNLQRDLTKAETSIYRNSYKHNLCLDMLKDGFHLSFKELFKLIHQQLAERDRAGPESLMWTQAMLQDQHDKLDMLKLYLTSAETAHRKGDHSSVYMARYELACYFQQTKDKWLADHFFKTCLDTSENINTDGGKTKAEGHCNVGLALEENGDNFEAADHFEEYYKLSQDHVDDWVKDDVKRGHLSFFTDACIHLYRIYSSIGNHINKDSTQLERTLEYHVAALEKAKESGDKKLIGEASYSLGLTHAAMNNTETALVHLRNFYDTCKATDDKEGMGRVCDAIAKAYAKLGSKEESIEYLKEFVETAESSGMDAELSQACHNLGNIYNSLGKYKEAGDYFNRAYNISRAMGEAEKIQVNRVQSGIAQAHAMLAMYSNIVVHGTDSRDYLERTMDWKSIRANIYESKAERTMKTMASEPTAPATSEEESTEPAPANTESQDQPTISEED